MDYEDTFTDSQLLEYSSDQELRYHVESLESDVQPVRDTIYLLCFSILYASYRKETTV